MRYKQLFPFLCFLIIGSMVTAGPDNIAPFAKVTASTTLSENFKASNVTDGIIGINGKGEWTCEGVTTDRGYIRFPWIQLDWNEPQLINKILLFDRPNMNDHIAGGKLLFSDGSEVFILTCGIHLWAGIRSMMRQEIIPTEQPEKERELSQMLFSKLKRFPKTIMET